MNHVSFGSLLREARIQKGYEINTVSRRLRIRPDIIKAIEDSDFERMPARGYARNMVNAYAKLVGLNPNTITRMYLDEIYAYQIGQAHNEADISRSMQRVNASQVRRSSSQRRPVDTYDDGYPRTPRNGRTPNRTMYTDDRRPGSSLYTQDQFHPSRRPVISEGNYLNAVAGGTGRGGSRFNPRTIIIIVAAIVVLLLLVFGISRCAGSHEEETQNIPVTGVESQQNSENGESTEAAPVVTETAPTSFTLAYNLADGNSTYIEVYVDGSTQEAHDVSGPAKKEYTSSDNIKFVCTDTSGLTVTVDGEEQKLEPNSNGVCTIDVKFQDILDKWNADHPAATSSSSSGTSSSTSSSSDASSSSDSSSSGTSSSSSSGSSNSTKGSGSSTSGSSSSGNSNN